MKNFSVRLSELFDSSLTYGRKPRSSSPEDRFLARGLSIKIRVISLFWGACADPEGGGWTGGQDPPPPEKAQKCRVSSQYWSGSPASSARQQNAISMTFRWRADDGPFILVTKLSRFIALTKLSRSAHGAGFLIILNQRTCRATECVECEITHMSKKRTQS